MEDLIAQVTQWVCTGGAIAVSVLITFTLFKQFLFIGRPNEILVFSGRTRKLADGSVLGYREVLEVFFGIHDPTTLNRQGADQGTRYRSVILYTRLGASWHSGQHAEVGAVFFNSDPE